MTDEIEYKEMDGNLCYEVVPVESNDIRIYWDGDKKAYYIVATINHRMHTFIDSGE